MARRIDNKDLIFWSVPIVIACAAGIYAFRALQGPDWVPPKDSPELRLVDPCALGRYRCRDGRVQTTTGERADGGPTCAYRDLSPCARGCVTEAVTLAVDEKVAKVQLCDMPKRPLALLSSMESLLDAPIVDAGMCDGDGYVPSSEGFIQCITRRANDPAATGVIIARATCRAGAVQTLDLTPRLIKREEAAAVWCNRDPIADVELLDAAVDAAPDADGGDAK